MAQQSTHFFFFLPITKNSIPGRFLQVHLSLSCYNGQNVGLLQAFYVLPMDLTAVR